jgi:putative N6-adenine-specific DNA methylase
MERQIPIPLGMFAACAPGLEPLVLGELKALGAQALQTVAGGVIFRGDLDLLMRANLHLRCATRVLLELQNFRVSHLAQLHKRAAKVDWAAFVPRGARVRVQVSCKRSRIYHSDAAAQRVSRALEDSVSARSVGGDSEAALPVRVHIERDVCRLSLDASGEALWRRGQKREVGAAPLRENLAAAGLLACGYDGAEPLLDPMCGSGTLLLEAGSIALNRAPGRERDFAFMHWAGFDLSAWETLLADASGRERSGPAAGLFGSDINAGAVGVSRRNLERAGLGEWVRLERRRLVDLTAPVERGLWISNPPYGARLGRSADLFGLYEDMGRVFGERFGGWRLALFTSQPKLAEATGLSFEPSRPAWPHGGLKIRLYRTARSD